MFPTLDLRAAATDHARGLIHGQGARAQVAHSVSTYARMFAGCGIGWAQACERAQAYADGRAELIGFGRSDRKGAIIGGIKRGRAVVAGQAHTAERSGERRAREGAAFARWNLGSRKPDPLRQRT